MLTIRISVLLFPLLCTFFLAAQSPSVEGDYAYLEELYLYLHQHPELSFQEEATSARMADELRGLGFEVHTKVGGHGVVGLFRNGEGPTVMVRADMDALPVTEETGLPYASQVRTQDEEGREVGVMHACGHDVHMSVWVGAARALVRQKDSWRGTLMFIAQPAEERSGGAKAMLGEGLFERFPVPDAALALHASPTLPAGTIGYRAGNFAANVDMLDIKVWGRGGHGAYPHTSLDPVVLAARMVVALQTLVSREISPLEPAVVTVGSIHGGSKGNVIPNEVDMQLTMRSYSDSVRQQIIRGIERICTGIARSAGVPEDRMPVFSLRPEYTPALYNDPELTERLREAWVARLGADRVKEEPPTMAGEDFGRFGRTAEDVPICLFWLGTVDPEKAAAASRGETELPPLHNSQFAPLPEPSILTGVEAMTAAALELLKLP